MGPGRQWRRGRAGVLQPSRRPAHRSARAALLALAVAGVLMVAACGGDATSTSVARPNPVVGLDPDLVAAASTARDRGADYLAARFDEIDPLHLSGIDYLHRRWGIDALAGAGAAGRAGLARLLGDDGDPSSDGDGGGENRVNGDPAEIRTLRRYIEPGYVDAPDRDALPESTALIASGLYCDQRPLSDDDLAWWDTLTERGGYDATHVLLAWFTAVEVGCSRPELTAAGERAADRVVADLNERTAGGLSPGDVDDLLIEQAAFLERVGRAGAIDPALIDAVIAAQLPDGGWPRVAGERSSDWHATALAVWLLSSAGGPGSDARWVES